MRLVAEVTGVVRDLRRTLNEVNRLSELLVNDVEKLRNLAKGVFTVRELFKGNIFAALGDFGKMMSGNKSAGSRQNPAD